MKKKAPDAIDLLDADHLTVHALFQSYRELVRAGAPALQRRALASRLDLQSLARSLTIRKEELRAVSEALREDALASAHA